MTHVAQTTINQWGNGLAVRINKVIAQAAGVKVGTCVRLTAQPGQLIIEKVEGVPSLAAMLAAFDPQRHGGEVMALTPIGKEIL